MFKKTKKSGFIFLEILIASALISVVFITLLGIGASVLNISSSIQKTTQANFLIKEEIEAARSFRDGAIWSSIYSYVNGNPHYLILNNGAWSLLAGIETIGIFTRKIVFSQVYRDANSNIVTSGGTLDVKSIKATVTVSWTGKTVQVVTYLTNWQNK